MNRFALASLTVLCLSLAHNYPACAATDRAISGGGRAFVEHSPSMLAKAGVNGIEFAGCPRCVTAPAAQAAVEQSFLQTLLTRLSTVPAAQVRVILSGVYSNKFSPGVLKPVKIFIDGPQHVRVEVSAASGIMTVVHNGSAAERIDETGAHHPLNSQRMLSRNSFIPALSALSYAPEEIDRLTLDKDSTGAIQLTVTPKEKKLGFKKYDHAIKFTVNADGLVGSMTYKQYSESGRNQFITVRIEYSDYEFIYGVAIPKTIVTFWDNEQHSHLTIQNVDLSYTPHPESFVVGGGK